LTEERVNAKKAEKVSKGRVRSHTWRRLIKERVEDLQAQKHRSEQPWLHRHSERQRPCLLRDLDITPLQVQPARPGKPEWTLTRAEVLSVIEEVERRIKRGCSQELGTIGQIAKRLGVGTGAEFKELSSSLNCWRENEQIHAKPVFIEEHGELRTRWITRRVVRRLRYRLAFNIERAAELWSTDCSVEAGIRLLRRLLDKEGGAALVRRLLDSQKHKPGPDSLDRFGTELLQQMLDKGYLPAKVVKESMRMAGFVNVRFDKICRKAHVIRRREPAGSDYATRDKCGCEWVYLLPRHDRKPAKDILLALLKNGPLWSREAKRQLRKAHWSPRSPIIADALMKLGIESRRPKCGVLSKRYYWCLPDQEPPTDELTSADKGDPSGEAAEQKQRLSLPDGPVPPNAFSLGGMCYRLSLSTLEYRLLECVWPERSVPLNTAVEHIYGHDADTTDDAVKSLLRNTNRRLRKVNCPIEFHQKRGLITLRVFNSD
jgi:hypothetical protein